MLPGRGAQGSWRRWCRWCRRLFRRPFTRGFGSLCAQLWWKGWRLVPESGRGTKPRSLNREYAQDTLWLQLALPGDQESQDGRPAGPPPPLSCPQPPSVPRAYQIPASIPVSPLSNLFRVNRRVDGHPCQGSARANRARRLHPALSAFTAMGCANGDLWGPAKILACGLAVDGISPLGSMLQPRPDDAGRGL